MDKKILVIGYVWPEPNSSAAGSHILSILQVFKEQNWQVVFASPAQLSPHRKRLSELGIEEVAIALNESSFDDFVQTLAPDVVLFDRFMMEEQFGWRVAKACPDALRVLDTEDLWSLRHARHKAVKQARAMTLSDYHTDLAKREIAAIFRSDLSLIISNYEYDLLRQHYQVPKSILHLCPFMMKLDTLGKSRKPFAEREHFITIGNFRHAPNWDAVLQLKSVYWPLIRKQLPKAELHIYGAYTPPKATALHDPKQGFLVKGWADGAEEVVSNARLSLSPLRFGAGIKGKLAESMYCGTPSVTTDVGAEGMHYQMPWPGQVANEVEDFVSAAVKLYTSEADWQLAQQQGDDLLMSHYRYDVNSQGLYQAILCAIEHKEQRREQNFIGAMLNHHSMQSTKYMGQWIEAKNKLESN